MNIDLKQKKPLTPADAFLTMLGGAGSEGKGGITPLPIDSLEPYPEQQTFRRYLEDKLAELAESIRENGILSPVIVRPLPGDGAGRYQILAGHNRTQAAKRAGLAEIPCIIKDVDDATARRIFVITNLDQRDHLLPSEKAAAYKLLMQGDKNGECQVGTAEEIAQLHNEGRRQVFRYLRLTFLIPPLLEMVDADTLAFLAGVNLSYLSEKSQWLLHDYITAEDLKIRLKQSERLKDAGADGGLDYETIDRIIGKKSAADRPKPTLKLPMKELRTYFGDLEDGEIAQKIVGIVRQHFGDQ